MVFFILEEFASKWNEHKFWTKWMHRLIMHLDKKLVDHPCLVSCSLSCFYDCTFTLVESEVAKRIFEMIDLERKGGSSDHRCIRNGLNVRHQ